MRRFQDMSLQAKLLLSFLVSGGVLVLTTVFCL